MKPQDNILILSLIEQIAAANKMFEMHTQAQNPLMAEEYREIRMRLIADLWMELFLSGRASDYSTELKSLMERGTVSKPGNRNEKATLSIKKKLMDLTNSLHT